MKANKKRIIQAGTAVLCAAMTTNTVLMSALAAENPAVEKDENVYVNLNGDGSVDSIYIVNEFDVDEASVITDYGNYTSVKNLSSDETIQMKGNKIEVKADAGKFYYQGQIKDTDIPWDIHITYYLDGEKISAEDLAGKSGKLKMVLSVKDNPDSEDDFYDNYLVQATVTLDTEKCSQIVADGATAANVGSDRQVMYNIMAGENKTYTITAQVKDFEMEGISFQAVPMAFDIDTDQVDKDELYDKTDELKDAADEFDDGASELQDGVSELKDGTQTLKDGSAELKSGAGELKSGTGELKSGAQTMEKSMNELLEAGSNLSKGAAQAADGSQTVSEGLSELYANMQLMENGANELHTALTQLTDQSGMLVSGSAEVLAALEQIQNSLSADMDSTEQNYQALESLKKQNSESAAYLKALASQASSVYSGLDSVKKAAARAVSGIDDVDGVVGNLNSIAELLEANNRAYETLEQASTELASQQMAALKTAMATLTEQYRQLDAGINSYTEGTGEIAKVYDAFCGAYTQVVQAAGALSDGAASVSDGSRAVAEGNAQMTSGIRQLDAGTAVLSDGIYSLYSGADALASGVNELYDGIGELSDGVGELSDGVDDLKDGTEEFKDKVKDMDSDIDDAIDDIVNEISGADYTPVSFASSDNEDIGLVQFAMKTQTISVEDEETAEEEDTTEKTFFQKLKDLF